MINLDRVAIEGLLTLEVPGGSGTVSIEGSGAGPLKVNASSYPALRRFADDARQANPELGPTKVIQQRNPLGQEVLVSVKGKALMRWPAGKKPQLVNVIRALRFLAK